MGTSFHLDVENVRNWQPVEEGVVGWFLVNLEDPAVSITFDPDDEGLLSVYGGSIPRLPLLVLGEIVHNPPPSDVLLLQLQAKGTRYNRVPI